jgi:hypothetical protein
LSSRELQEMPSEVGIQPPSIEYLLDVMLIILYRFRV